MKIRKATRQDAANIAKVHVDSWRTTYKHIVQAEFLDSLNYEDRTQRWERIVKENSVYVAETNDSKIIGFSSGGKEREENYTDYDGELYAIYILKGYQRKGIGKKLVKPVVEQFIQEGFNSMLVWVLAANDGKYFYEKLGGKYIDNADIKIGGKKLEEFAYGWTDLENLRKSLSGFG